MGDNHAFLDAKTMDECIVDQNWDAYTDENHETWGALFDRQMDILKDRACDEFLEGVDILGLNGNHVPDFKEMNERLMAATGWEVIAVPGLIPSKPFFSMLENRKFPAGNFIRKKEELDYLEEPDIFHDVFGHVPPLTNPAYADYMEAYGRAGRDAIANKGVKYLARLNWYTIEFGLMGQGDDVKIYGAGIASSYGEAKYALDNPSPNHIKFDLDRVMRTGYYIDDLQATYFVIDSFESLFEKCIEEPFVPLYHKYRQMDDLTPFEIYDDDEVLQKGSGDYWQDFPKTKARLK